MKNVTIKINITTLIIIGITILFICGGGFSIMNNTNKRLNVELEQERKLIVALNDSLRVSTNKYGEVVSEKLTLQTTLENLEKISNQLTEDQRNLLRRLQVSEKEKSVISATLIRANFIVDSLLHAGEVLIGDSIITFVETNNPDIQYTIDVLDVMPISNELTPRMLFRSLNIPNDSYVEFFWKDDRREGYPVSFSVTNTNRFMKVHNIESFAIPSLQKEELDPNTWQKFNRWLDNVGGGVGKYVVGGVIGFGLAVLILR